METNLKFKDLLELKELIDKNITIEAIEDLESIKLLDLVNILNIYNSNIIKEINEQINNKVLNDQKIKLEELFILDLNKKIKEDINFFNRENDLLEMNKGYFLFNNKYIENIYLEINKELTIPFNFEIEITYEDGQIKKQKIIQNNIIEYIEYFEKEEGVYESNFETNLDFNIKKIKVLDINKTKIETKIKINNKGKIEIDNIPRGKYYLKYMPVNTSFFIEVNGNVSKITILDKYGKDLNELLENYEVLLKTTKRR